MLPFTRQHILILVFVLTVVRFVLIGLEIWIARRRKLNVFCFQEFRVNIMTIVVQRALGFLIPSVGPIYVYLYQNRILDPAPMSPFTLLWGFFLVDFAYYCGHRFMHYSRWAWATHIAHHSHRTFSFSLGFRVGVTLITTGSWIFAAIMPFFGIHPLLIGFYFTVHNFHQFLLHTEIFPRMRYIDWLFMTPFHHRVHHSKLDEHINCNYGGMFVIFDKLFGTFIEVDEKTPISYGIKNPIPENFIAVNTHGWILLYRSIFGKSETTSEQLVEAEGELQGVS